MVIWGFPTISNTLHNRTSKNNPTYLHYCMNHHVPQLSQLVIQSNNLKTNHFVPENQRLQCLFNATPLFNVPNPLSPTATPQTRQHHATLNGAPVAAWLCLLPALLKEESDPLVPTGKPWRLGKSRWRRWKYPVEVVKLLPFRWKRNIPSFRNIRYI